ncbi:hypothetical protein DFH07DRAFT_783899 [Mycena maculata]|uniref:Uncharacterized protein n=1 Tax=Mycena maculata TaxID=230809 RepID=A0AAD7MM00_9AGAR|nr:hypothetical protein DFH07DRAFT_783899 [Mycena maculata]
MTHSHHKVGIVGDAVIVPGAVGVDVDSVDRPNANAEQIGALNGALDVENHVRRRATSRPTVKTMVEKVGLFFDTVFGNYAVAVQPLVFLLNTMSHLPPRGGCATCKSCGGFYCTIAGQGLRLCIPGAPRVELGSATTGKSRFGNGAGKGWTEAWAGVRGGRWGRAEEHIRTIGVDHYIPRAGRFEAKQNGSSFSV